MASSLVGQISLIDYIYNEQWKQLLAGEFSKDYMKQIESLLTQHYKNTDTICPEKDLIFHALNMTPLEEIRAVIVGQDPYTSGQFDYQPPSHPEGNIIRTSKFVHATRHLHMFIPYAPILPLATGLAFSVPFDATIPPSLGNIFKLFKMIIPGFEIPNHGCLDLWASNGILLLNSILTVTAGTSTSKSLSHSTYGWQELTDAIIRIISETCNGVIFILFGSVAHKKEGLIDITKHAIYEFPHPSPLSMSAFLKNPEQLNRALHPIGVQIPLSQVNWTLYNV